MNRALVTGATGYTGSRLVRALLARGVEVTALVRADSDLSRWGPDGSRVRTKVDDRSAPGLIEIFRLATPEAVFHLAAAGGYSHDTEDIDPMVAANIHLGVRVFEAARAVGAPVVSAGSYWQHYDGSDAYFPNSLYAATKQAQHDLLLHFALNEELPAVTLELYDTYGPEDFRPKILNLLERASTSPEPIALSPGEQLLDLVYVDDVVAAFTLAAEKLMSGEIDPGGSWAVRTEHPVTLRELVKTYARVSGRHPSIQWGGRPYRKREVMHPRPGPTLPGWSARVGLEKGLKLALGLS